MASRWTPERRAKAAQSWTPERRARMAEIIRERKPWKKSTGPVTAKGKRKASKNASRSARAIFKRQLRNIRRGPSELKTHEETGQSAELLEIKGLVVNSIGSAEAAELESDSQTSMSGQTQANEDAALSQMERSRASGLQSCEELSQSVEPQQSEGVRQVSNGSGETPQPPSQDSASAADAPALVSEVVQPAAAPSRTWRIRGVRGRQVIDSSWGRSKGLHYNGIGGASWAAVILGGAWAGRVSRSLSSSSFSSGSGCV